MPRKSAILIKEFLLEHGISQKKLAEKLGLKASNFNRALNHSEEMGELMISNVSITLKHNFFADIAKELEKEINDETYKNIEDKLPEIAEALMKHLESKKEEIK